MTGFLAAGAAEDKHELVARGRASKPLYPSRAATSSKPTSQPRFPLKEARQKALKRRSEPHLNIALFETINRIFELNVQGSGPEIFAPS